MDRGGAQEHAYGLTTCPLCSLNAPLGFGYTCRSHQLPSSPARTETFSLHLQGIVTGATVPHISQSQIEGFRSALLSLAGLICEVLDRSML
jgi:hypothetical protein